MSDLSVIREFVGSGTNLEEGGGGVGGPRADGRRGKESEKDGRTTELKG